MSFFSSVAHILHPVSKSLGIGVKKHPVNYSKIEQQGIQKQRQTDLASEEKDYSLIPDRLKEDYTHSAMQAGTYGNTPEFAQGLGSEVQAGARGARFEARNRINALRKALGMEAFNPEEAGQTAGALTGQQLMDDNKPEAVGNQATPEPVAETPAKPAPQAAPATSVASVQSATPTKARQGLGFKPKRFAPSGRLGAIQGKLGMK